MMYKNSYLGIQYRRMSTPCRIVFGVSQATDTGFGLNNMLAKGENNMEKLLKAIFLPKSCISYRHSRNVQLY